VMYLVLRCKNKLRDKDNRFLLLTLIYLAFFSKNFSEPLLSKKPYSEKRNRVCYRMRKNAFLKTFRGIGIKTGKNNSVVGL
jgi:hypothetical protein